MNQNTDNLRGILFMLGAMAGFALGDVGIKALAGAVPPGQIMVTMGLLGAVIFAVWTRASGVRLFTSDLRHPAVATRCLAETFAGTAMVMALTLTPLSLVTSVLQAAPLVVALGAALVFGERIGPHRWAAILLGLVGVLIVLRPGLEGFDPQALWSVAAMLGLTARDLATRAAPPGLHNLQLSTVGIFSLIPSGLILFTFTDPPVWPDVIEWGLLLFTILSTVAGYYAITSAMRLGQIGAVTPFRYSRLLFGLAFGIVLFSERPDFPTYLGGALIVATGLYAIWRERRSAAKLP